MCHPRKKVPEAAGLRGAEDSSYFRGRLAAINTGGHYELSEKWVNTTFQGGMDRRHRASRLHLRGEHYTPYWAAARHSISRN